MRRCGRFHVVTKLFQEYPEGRIETCTVLLVMRRGAHGRVIRSALSNDFAPIQIRMRSMAG
jgi:hypothetical protein